MPKYQVEVVDPLGRSVTYYMLTADSRQEAIEIATEADGGDHVDIYVEEIE